MAAAATAWLAAVAVGVSGDRWQLGTKVSSPHTNAHALGGGGMVVAAAAKRP